MRGPVPLSFGESSAESKDPAGADSTAVKASRLLHNGLGHIAHDLAFVIQAAAAVVCMGEALGQVDVSYLLGGQRVGPKPLKEATLCLQLLHGASQALQAIDPENDAAFVAIRLQQALCHAMSKQYADAIAVCPQGSRSGAALPLRCLGHALVLGQAASWAQLAAQDGA